MAKITDPDDLNQGTEVVIDASTTPPTISLVATGNLSDDGVTHQCLYSFLKEEWKNDPNLIKYDFPLISITTDKFEWVENWEPLNDTTRYLIRDAGWREIDSSSVIKREYMGIISLGSIGATTRPYFVFSSDSAKTDFNFDGPINQGIQTFGNASNGNFDKRSDSLTIFARSQGNTFSSATSASIGITGDLNYKANPFPLSEAVDSKIVASDSTIGSSTPYTGMSITFGAVTRTIGGVSYNYNIVIDGNNGTTQQIYEFVQYSLRLASDIDAGAGTSVGFLTQDLLKFEGDTLKSTTGVYIDNTLASDRNNLVFTDTGGVERSFPFLATGTLTFNANLVNDSSAIFRMFFTSGFGSTGAILVDDNSGTDISGNVGGAATFSFTFDYDGNSQGGRTPGTDADVTVVAIGLNTAQYVSATATITRSTGQNISLVAPLERNYDNS
jgi:hypothetical protein